MASWRSSSWSNEHESWKNTAVDGTGTYVIAGDTSGEDPGGGGSGTTTSTTATGDWYVLSGVGGGGDSDSLILGGPGVFSEGATGETTFPHIVDIKKDLPGMAPAASPSDDAFEEMMGEALDGLTGIPGDTNRY